MVWIWTGIIVLSIIIEVATCGLVSIWFTLGALVCLIIALLGGVAWYIQVVVFIITSILFLIVLRHYLEKLVKKDIKPTTGLEPLIGKEVTLSKTIELDTFGEIEIHGIIYSAALKDEAQAPILAGTRVRVVGVDGNKIIVEK